MQTIVIINEDQDAGHAVRKLLAGENGSYRLINAEGVDEGLRRVIEEPGDVLLVDYSCAQGRWGDIFSLSGESDVDPAVIVIGAPDETAAARAIRMGACDCLHGAQLDGRVLCRAIRYASSFRQARRALHNSEQRYRQLLDSLTDYVYTVKVENGRAVGSSHGPGCVAVTGYTSQEYAADPFLWYSMIYDQDRPIVMKSIEAIRSGSAVSPLEHRIVHKDGTIRWIKNTIVPRRNAEGCLVGYDGLVSDITERKRAEIELTRVNKALQALSACNQTVIHSPTETDLLSNVCRIVVHTGGYHMCWIGYTEGGERMCLRPQAWVCEEQECSRRVHDSRRNSADEGPAEASVKTGRPVVVRDVARSIDFPQWKVEVSSCGCEAMVALPLNSGTRTFGVLAICSREPGAFDEAEVRYLADLADGLAYGIEALRTRVRHRQVEDALHISEEKLKREFANLAIAKKEWEVTFDAISDPLFICDGEQRIVRANNAYQEASGIPFTKLIERPYYSVFPIQDVPEKTDGSGRELTGGAAGTDRENIAILFLDRVYRHRVYPIYDGQGARLRSVHVLEDITDMKRAEEHIRQEMDITASLLDIAETTSPTMDVEMLSEHVVRCVNRIMGCDDTLSYLWEKERKFFRPSQRHGLTDEIVSTFSMEPIDENEVVVNLAFERKKPVVMRPERREDGSSYFAAIPFADGAGVDGQAVPIEPTPWMETMNTILVIPLFGKTDRLGLIICAFRNQRVFSTRDWKIAEGISRQVSLALNEAYLYRTAMERSLELANKIETIQVIHEIDRSILSTLEPDEVLETAVRNVTRIIPCDWAEILLIDTEKKGFIHATGRGLRGARRGAFFPFHHTSASEVISTCRPQYVANAEMASDLLPRERDLLKKGILSYIRVPLAVRGQISSILGIYSRQLAAFTAENLSTLEKFAVLIGVAMEKARLLSDSRELFIGTVKSLSSAIDAKSTWTAGHSQRVTKYALLIGREMGFSETMLQDLELAGLLHDIGKIGTYDNILDKPAGLTASEYEIVKKHSQRGAELLMPIKQLNAVIPWIRHHHEQFDGSGYPDGLKGDEIPLMARVLAVVDSFDSMTVERPYRTKLEREMAIQELKRCSGTQFDPKVVDVFLKILHETNRTQTLDIAGGLLPGKDDSTIGSSKTLAERNGACNKRTLSDA